ncbi:hypothetical protein OFN26_28810, partial [Escherichia coli]|nr:hypothetical protein [Escherichia coli]
GVFSGCRGLTTIPAGLFANSASVTTFFQAFYECTGLTAIPSGLFADCVSVTTFRRTFYGCSGLRTLGDNVFAGCVSATTFEDTFFFLIRLPPISTLLSDASPFGSTFFGAFYECTGLIA